jgi:hypothetical protein
VPLDGHTTDRAITSLLRYEAAQTGDPLSPSYYLMATALLSIIALMAIERRAINQVATNGAKPPKIITDMAEGERDTDRAPLDGKLFAQHGGQHAAIAPFDQIEEPDGE